MQIHTDRLTYGDIHDAARLARSWLFRSDEKGSRSRARKFDVIISGSSTRQMNFNDEQAATWDEWGIFLGELFRRDPEAHSWAYKGQLEFRMRTYGRFDHLRHEDQCPSHNWKPLGNHVGACSKCNALQSWLPKGRPVVVKHGLLNNIHEIDAYLDSPERRTA